MSSSINTDSPVSCHAHHFQLILIPRFPRRDSASQSEASDAASSKDRRPFQNATLRCCETSKCDSLIGTAWQKCLSASEINKNPQDGRGCSSPNVDLHDVWSGSHRTEGVWSEWCGIKDEADDGFSDREVPQICDIAPKKGGNCKSSGWHSLNFSRCYYLLSGISKNKSGAGFPVSTQTTAHIREAFFVRSWLWYS